MPKPEDTKNLKLSAVLRKSSQIFYHEAQLELIREGYEEIKDKQKIINGIEPHPENIDTDKKPN